MLPICAYFALQNRYVQTFLIQKIALNFSKQINSKITVGKVDIAFPKKIIFEKVLIEGQNNDTLFYTQHLSAKIDTLKIRQKKISIAELELQDNKIVIERDSANHYNFSFLAEAFQKKNDTTQLWQIKCTRFGFNNSDILFADLTGFKNTSVNLSNINFEISDFSVIPHSTYFKIKELSLNDGKTLYLDNLTAEVSLLKEKIEIKKFRFETHNSIVNDSDITLDFENNSNSSIAETKFDIMLSGSEISFLEIAELLPLLKGMDTKVNLSGHVYGTLSDITGKNIMLKTGQNTSAFLDFYINDVTKAENMYLFVDLINSQATFNDLSRIRLPDIANAKYMNFPESFYQVGIINYKGNFTGFLSDFVTFGTFTSPMGVIKTDLAVVPETDGKIKYNGNLATSEFNLGKLLQEDDFGLLTFDGKIDGNFDKVNKSYNGKFNGAVSEIEFYNYTYTNIALDGELNNKMFDGVLSVNDPNLDLNFTGKINFRPEMPVFDFNLLLNKALTANLNLSNHFPDSELACKVTASFTGNKLDNMEGVITVDDGIYQNRRGKFNLNGIQLSSLHNLNEDILTFNSEYFDVEIIGTYHFQNLLNSMHRIIHYYIPAIKYEEGENENENIFEYQLNVKNLDVLTTVFMPNVRFQSSFVVYGMINSNSNIFTIEGSIPGFIVNDILVRDIFIGNKPQGDEYSSRFRVGEISLRNGMLLKNIDIDSKITDNNITNHISWKNNDNNSYSGHIQTHSIFTYNGNTNNPHIEIECLPSQIYIADSLWQISPFTAVLDTTAIEIKNFRFFNNEQQITLDGKISENDTDLLSVEIQNIALDKIQSYLNAKLNISGLINGSAEIKDFYKQKIVTSDIGIKNLVLQSQNIGDISFSNSWNNTESVLNTEIVINNNNKETLRGEGTLHPANRDINYDFQLDSFPIVILETVLQNTFSDINGTATGKVKVHGSPNNILLNGALLGTNAGLTINYTKAAYSFNDSIYFNDNTLLFKNITIQDINGNQGIFNGTITHQNFKNMVYDLSISSPKIMALNTTQRDNQQFFGHVFVNGRFEITGQDKAIRLTGTGTTLSETDVNISLEHKNEIEQYDFIRFVTAEESEKQEFSLPVRKNNGNFSLNLTVMVTSYARVQLIFNSQIGDVIRAQGEGVLVFGLDNEGNITLSGSYTVERGDYLFTLQNVMNKFFNIEQGGTITWSGSPYNAFLNINAVYNLRTSLHGLLASNANVNQDQRVPVECKIKLSEELSSPVIQFEINFPTVEDHIVDELQQYFSTEEDMNKQMLSLLVLGKFYMPEYMRGVQDYENQNLIGTTASELFSNQLSNWLSQATNLFDLGFNYRPGNNMTSDEIELALSTQLFNDRVTINGNVGNAANTNTNANQFVGDFDINVKLIPSGKIQFKAYNRSNNNLIYETSPYTQGIGLTFKEEYNTVQELLNKMKTLFRTKETEITNISN
ncbi:MAG: translocation/assembly module TamB [Bacteroidales bacterium]|nr:translocation/assembly module TamB [Bacteroidales bacterium]